MNLLIAYIKGNKYDSYKAVFEGNEEIKAFSKTFEDYEEFLDFVTEFSNYYSIKVQFYY